MSDLILLIDDDQSLRRVTEYNLGAKGFIVVTAASGKEGLESFETNTPDLVVTDVKLGDMSGLDILATIKEKAPDIPVIIMTAFGSIEMAVQAMHKGAFNFITKPFERETLIQSCKKALELSKLQSRTKLLSNEINRLTGTQGIVSASSVMKELLETASRAANSEATILISGESGTGKEVLARLIHQNSPKRNGPMVAVNCAAIPAGLIESELFGHVKGSFTGAIKDRKGHFQTAAGGTLFLDEIGELTTDIQVKLLRAIQEKEVQAVGSERVKRVDIRIIAATNLDLKQQITQGKFREDLYYRLSVIPLFIPPLRERTEDIPALVKHFLKKFDAPRDVGFSSQALAILKTYHWPGNIREMQNIIERCIILRKQSVIEPEDLQLLVNKPSSSALTPVIPDEGIALEDIEKSYILKALEKANQNRSKAARLLKIPRHVLLYRLEKYGL
ncbi:sigma-54-dependent transcriptional regulator [Desulfobacula toluolica]|uniref:ZraR2: two component system response regulator, sigma54-specific n=1 Tax=Desulfobacula toluolica (strain DSM 7467 / Tol2) TaxID=651182 RepID=K0NSY5_DESTT|nr:sigma-54 dependent transcriptional regulator [Desulfobacula toluolica]CCK82122.1 ZraR2: two component system response regulator, sigma54-specific [Desulfobacula toluolica Tol2]